jgi:transitional endoplasmic reticulum ATPase
MQVAQDTEGFVGADLETVCREAGLLAMRAQKTNLGIEEFIEAKAKVHPTMNPIIREFYVKIQNHFKTRATPEMQLSQYQ